MSDERLLSEALRAHAAGGVSTPRTDPPPSGPGTPPGPGADSGPGDAASGRRRRFRPLGRGRRAEPDQDAAGGEAPHPVARAEVPPADAPRTEALRPDHARADVPAPRSAGPGRPPPGYARGPMRPAPGTGPVRSGPPSGGFGVPTGQPRAYGRPPQAPPPQAPATPPAPEGSVPWGGATVAWWSAVAVLAGGVVGGAIGVLSLLLPA